MLIPQSKSYIEGKRKRTIAQVLSLGPMSTKIIGVVLIALLSLFYLGQTIQSSTKGYAVQNLEDRKETLEATKDELSVEATRLKSLQEVESKAEELNLEPEK